MAQRVVIVTGATSGIGLATAQLLAESGYTVEGVGRSAEKVAALYPLFRQELDGDKLGLRPLDVRDVAATRAFVDEVVKKHGRIDALINAAGLLKFEETHAVSEDCFDLQFDTLFRGVFFLTTAVLPHMIRAGGGVIVNIGSVAGERASPKMAVYAAAKAALVNFTKTLALEYADRNIRALCINAGGVQTKLMDKVMFAMIQKKTPLKRLAQPRELAVLVRYLLSEDATYFTGSTVTIDGGSGL